MVVSTRMWASHGARRPRDWRRTRAIMTPKRVARRTPAAPWGKPATWRAPNAIAWRTTDAVPVPRAASRAPFTAEKSRIPTRSRGSGAGGEECCADGGVVGLFEGEPHDEGETGNHGARHHERVGLSIDAARSEKWEAARAGDSGARAPRSPRALGVAKRTITRSTDANPTSSAPKPPTFAMGRTRRHHPTAAITNKSSAPPPPSKRANGNPVSVAIAKRTRLASKRERRGGAGMLRGASPPRLGADMKRIDSACTP